MTYFWIGLILLLVGVATHDLLQKKHTLLRVVPIFGHFRFFLEKFGAPFRQYFFTSNRDELPFNRSDREWIYASAKGENIEKGFGSDKDFSHPNHFFIKPALIPGVSPDTIAPLYEIKPKKIIGANRRKPYYPDSCVGISSMSFGALSGAAVEALNRGAYIANCHQGTGEGGLSPYHLKTKAKIILQFGTGYFGARTADGKFDFNKLKQIVDTHPQIVAIEFKISQGAKPLKLSKFPSSKMTEEIRNIRGLKPEEDAISPAYHSMFSTNEEMLNFIEKVAELSGLPVGIKCSVGREDSWESLCKAIVSTGHSPDYIVYDGSEGGTGSSPESYSSYVGIPFQYGFATMYKIFQKYGLIDKITFIGSGKLGLPHKAIMAFAMGASIVNIGRENLMSIGCLQTQHCHVGGSAISGGCPVGIATQNKWSQNGLDPIIKGKRAANYLIQLRKEIMEITNSAGYNHYSEIRMSDIMVNSGDSKGLLSLEEIYGYEK